MGNSPMGNGNNSSYQIKLDNGATIYVIKGQDCHERKQWRLMYVIDGITSMLSILRIRNSVDEFVNVLLHVNLKESPAGRLPCETIAVMVPKEKEKAGLLCTGFDVKVHDLNEGKPAKNGVSCKGEVETHYRAYGCGTRMSLLVMEKNKKRPNMVTLAHYYVNRASGENFRASGVDIGFSIVVKIGIMSNGQIDFSVDGPVEHPSSALLYMIEEVTRTGTWKLSACPHCKNIQQQRRWLSESEDSDTPLPPPLRYGGPQNAANMGQFNGDCNGCIMQARQINFKWRN